MPRQVPVVFWYLNISVLFSFVLAICPPNLVRREEEKRVVNSSDADE